MESRWYADRSSMLSDSLSDVRSYIQGPVAAMKIDTHQHFWSYNDRDYVWMSAAMGKLRRDHLPKDLLPLINAAGIDATIAVQARQCLEESTWLLELAEEYPFIRAVVGWVDLCSEG